MFQFGIKLSFNKEKWQVLFYSPKQEYCVGNRTFVEGGVRLIKVLTHLQPSNNRSWV